MSSCQHEAMTEFRVEFAHIFDSFPTVWRPLGCRDFASYSRIYKSYLNFPCSSQCDDVASVL